MTAPAEYGASMTEAVAAEIRKRMLEQDVTIVALAEAIGKGVQATTARLSDPKPKPFTMIEFALAAKRLGVEPHVLMYAVEQREVMKYFLDLGEREGAASWAASPLLPGADAPGSWAAEATHDRPPMFCPDHPAGTIRGCADCRQAHERWRAWQISQFVRQTGATEDEASRTLDASWAVSGIRYPECQPSGAADDSGLLLRELLDGLAELVDRLRDRQERLITGESTHQHSVACCAAGVRFSSRVPHRSSSARSTDAAEHSRDCARCAIAEAAHGAWVSGAVQ